MTHVQCTQDGQMDEWKAGWMKDEGWMEGWMDG